MLRNIHVRITRLELHVLSLAVSGRYTIPVGVHLGTVWTFGHGSVHKTVIPAKHYIPLDGLSDNWQRRFTTNTVVNLKASTRVATTVHMWTQPPCTDRNHPLSLCIARDIRRFSQLAQIEI